MLSNQTCLQMSQFTEWLKWCGDLPPLRTLLHASHTANKTAAFYIHLMVDGVIEGRTNHAVQQDPVFHTHTHGQRAAVTFHRFLVKMWESCEETSSTSRADSRK